jgi:alpha-tubulin suppressor-like RCC1 family protein
VDTAAGEDHSLALTSTGQVLAWGNNESGQLGDGTFKGPQSCGGIPCSTTPVKVKLPKGTKVVQVSAGGGFSLALTSTGQVLGWGFNHGELGDGTRTSHDHPVEVKLPKGTKAVAVAAGGNHGMALTRRGVVFTWGYNRFGELGDGTTTNSLSPVKVSLPPGTKAAAVAAGSDYSLALTRTGQILAWGFNADGELGNDTFTGPTTCTRFHYGCATTPVQVQLPLGTKVAALAAGGDHALALTSNHHVLAWGNNTNGQLGDGPSTAPDKCLRQERCATMPVYVQLPKGTTVVEVATGFRHSLALTSTGQVLAWGYSADGQLGNGNRTKCDHPVKVDLPKGDKATLVRSGPVADHSLALVHSQ